MAEKKYYSDSDATVPARDDSQGVSTGSRRTFLKAVAAGTVVGGIGVTAGQGPTLEFGGQISGWVGQAPSGIEGQTNPTLELRAGRTYTVRWENLDGAPHNFAFLDEQGDRLPVIRTDDGEATETEIASGQGSTQTFRFVADPAIAEYICTVHPGSMRGSVAVQEGGTTTAAEETTTQDAARLIPRGPTVGLRKVADGPIRQPVGFQIADEDRDRRFVVDQNGQIYVHGPDGLQSEPFLDVQEKLRYLTDTRGGFDRSGDFDERGLLGLAFHPEFRDNRRFFVRYSAPLREEDFAGPDREGIPESFDHTFVLSEYRATEDLSAARPDSERIILEIPEPQFNHNAGDLAFGPDGYLYVTVGDGGGANDTGIGHVDDWYDRNDGGNGQDVDQNLLGSILRIDVDEQADGKPYAIPEDNPFAGTDARFPEHYAWGFRNPWRMSFNDGELFVADVGQNLFEEVNVVEKGGNYGWNVKEATHCFSPSSASDPPQACPDATTGDVRGGEPLVDPIIEYPHVHQGQPVGISVTGGYVAQSDAVPEIRGRYVFGDWSRSFSEPRGRLFVATRPDGEGLWPIEELVVEGGRGGEINRFVLAFGRDRNGDLYVCTSETGGVTGNGAVYKIVPSDEGERIAPPGGETTGTTTEA